MILESARRLMLLVAAVVFVAACDRGEITGARWQEMTAEQKTLVVKSLIGGETATARKGGPPRSYSGTADEYVERIDAAYNRGDRRNVEEIWRDLAD